jgi:hypothetical protein
MLKSKKQFSYCFGSGAANQRDDEYLRKENRDLQSDLVLSIPKLKLYSGILRR